MFTLQYDILFKVILFDMLFTREIWVKPAINCYHNIKLGVIECIITLYYLTDYI